jgi:hypothetical protein
MIIFRLTLPFTTDISLISIFIKRPSLDWLKTTRLNRLVLFRFGGYYIPPPKKRTKLDKLPEKGRKTPDKTGQIQPRNYCNPLIP